MDGLSIGITSDLSSIRKILTILLMFIGMVGELIFGFGLLGDPEQEEKIIKNDLAM